MAVLSIKWETAERISPATATVTPREGEEEESEKAPVPRAEKPMLVWIQDPAEAEADDKITKVTLDPDKIRVGSCYFRCVKITREHAEADPLLAESGKKFPRMVLVTTDYEAEQVLEGKISSSKLYSAMKKVAKKTYEGNFDRSVKKVIKLLGTLDKIANERKVLSDKEEKGLKPAEAKKVAREREALEKEEKEVLEERKELLNPERKAA